MAFQKCYFSAETNQALNFPAVGKNILGDIRDQESVTDQHDLYRLEDRACILISHMYFCIAYQDNSII